MDNIKRAISKILSVALVLSVLFCYTVTPSPAFAEEGDGTGGAAFTHDGGIITQVTPVEGQTDLTIPEELDGVTITGLAPGCFSGCDSIITLNLPKTLTDLHPATFEGLTSLTAIDIEPGEHYHTVDGVLVYTDRYQPVNPINTISLTTLVYYPRAKTDTYYMPPYGVGDMEEDALVSPFLKTLELPGTYTYWSTRKINYINHGGTLEEDLLTADCPNLTTLILDGPLFGPEENLDRSDRCVTLPASFLTTDGCGSLTTLCIPNHEPAIVGDMNGEKANILVQGAAGSEAEEWAEENGFRFQALSETVIDSTITRAWNFSTDRSVESDPFSAEHYGAERIKYYVLDAPIASVDENGTVTPKKPGYTTVIAYVQKTDTALPCWSFCHIYLQKGAPRLTIAGADEDGVIRVKPNAAPFNLNVSSKYDDLKYTYLSSDPAIASVDNTGLVTLGEGVKGDDTATITVKSAMTERCNAGTTSVTIKVGRYSQNVKIEGKTTRTVTFGKKPTVKGTAKTGVYYTTSNSKCATVNRETGVVTFLHPGTVTIWANAKQGDLYEKASAKVVITSKLKQPTLKVTKPRKGAAKLTWTKVPGATKYVVYVKYPGKTSYKAVLTKPGDVKSVTHSKLKKGKTYRYRVRAVMVYNGHKYYSPYSESVKIKI